MARENPDFVDLQAGQCKGLCTSNSRGVAPEEAQAICGGERLVIRAPSRSKVSTTFVLGEWLPHTVGNSGASSSELSVG